MIICGHAFGLFFSTCDNLENFKMSTPEPKAQITHVIFDMDGLLIDTERLYTIVYDKVCGKYGKTFTWEIKQKLMGRKTMESAQMIIDILKLPVNAEQWVREISDEMTTIMPDAKLLPGADRFVRHLHKHSIPIAVATGSSTPAYDLKTTHHKDFFNLFHHIVCSGDDLAVHHGKPAPDIFQVASNRFKENPPASPRNVLVFEDAPNGVLSGKAADMWVVMIPDERLIGTDDTISADQVLKNMEDIIPEEWGLPPFNQS
ncbi:pseudouridine-5'-phosphatase [Strongylocentrotus purpuratus]|uniref:pseudouridine 5'-phosphatase n=1 Tax=Strongylocentrotus purpuratus TaxID=7668 RepID=A0A7M7NMS4_STRPU|nr:pseudouridine-5'-phosphatase [Strongylocentrotus purpuratus]